EARRQLVHRVADLFRNIDGIGSGRLIDPDRGGRGAIEAAVAVLGSCAHFDPCDVTYSDYRSVRIGAQHDCGEFLRLSEAAFGFDIDLNLLFASDRSGANAAERRLDILVLNGQDNVVRSEVELSQPIRIEPDAQRVI